MQLLLCSNPHRFFLLPTDRAEVRPKIPVRQEKDEDADAIHRIPPSVACAPRH